LAWSIDQQRVKGWKPRFKAVTFCCEPLGKSLTFIKMWLGDCQYQHHLG
jgi:hypothetical protein